MFIRVITLLTLFFTCLSNSQDLKEWFIKDSIRLEFLRDKIYNIYIEDVEQAERLIKEAEMLAEKLKEEPVKAELIYYKAGIAENRAKYSESISLYNDALKRYKELGKKRGISYCLNAIGIVYYNKGEFSKAIEFYKKSLVIDKELNDLSGVSACYNNIANIYVDQGDYKKGVDYYLRAKEIKEKVKDYNGIFHAYINIAIVYTEQGKYSTALSFLKKADIITKNPNFTASATGLYLNVGNVYKVYEEYNETLKNYKEGLDLSYKEENKRMQALFVNSIGQVYKDQKKYDLALSFFVKALEINKEVGIKLGIMSSLKNIGSVQLLKKEYVEAAVNYRKSLAVSKEMNYSIGMFEANYGLAAIHMQKKEYIKALDKAKIAQTILGSTNKLDDRRDLAKLFSEVYNNRKEYKKAFESYRHYKKLSDSIFNKENIRKIAELEYEYKYKQELELANFRELKLTKKVKKTSSELQQSKLNLLIGVIVFLLISIVLGIRIFLLKIRNIKSVNENILIEQKLLRSQMTPHFIFNSLSVLQGVILNNETTKAVKYLSKFSKLLRITLENSRDKLVLLEKELEAVENYIIVQNLGAEVPFEYEIQKVEEINEKEMLVPPMLIQPFVENAIEHAFEEDQKDRKISVHLKYTGEQLVCLILDNGIGIEAKKEKVNLEKKSLATTITAERLRMLSKEFNVEASITVKDRSHSNQKGTEVVLVLPHKRA